MRQIGWGAAAITLLVASACGGGDESGGADAGPDGSTSEPTAPGEPASPPLQSGSRLRARTIEVAGRIALAGWYDRELATPCESRTAADGEKRCLPSTSHTRDALQAVYADAACTAPIVYLTPCEGRPQYVWLNRIAACEPLRQHVHPVGAAIDPAMIYRRGLDGTCIAEPVGARRGGLYALEPEMPAGRFVATETEPEEAMTRLRRWEMHGADGSVAIDQTTFYDSELEASCRWSSPDADGVGHCLPGSPSLNQLQYFSDGACTQPAVMACGSDAKYHRRFDTAFELGPALPNVFEVASASCQATPAPAPYTFYPLGDPLAPEDLVAGTLRWETGEDLVASSRWQTTEGTVLPVFGRLRVGDPAEECTVARAADGELRCMPLDGIPAISVSSTNHFYADAACTREIEIARLDCSQGCSISDFTRAQKLQCDGSYRVYEEAVALTTFYQQVDELPCRQGVVQPQSLYVELTGEVAPAEFPLAVEVIE